MANIPWETLRAETITTPEQEAAIARIRQIADLEQRLYDLRQALGVSQTELARRLEVSQANVSRIEHEHDLKLSTLRGYIAALGGELELHAVFPDGNDVVLAGPRAVA
jgi:DNA-binding XRE family transcriptional regulator